MNGVAALLSAFCISVLSAVALAFQLGGLNRTAAIVSLAAGIFAGALQYAVCGRCGGTSAPRRKISGWDWAVIAVYTLFSLRAFCWLAYWSEGNIQFLSPNNLGDLSLHITYINNLAFGVPFWPENPIFAGAGIHYPIGVDLFNSLLKLAGLDVCQGLVCVGLASSAVTLVALYKWGRGFVIAGFLFNGGLAGFQFLSNLHLLDYQSELAWKSIPLAMFVTQRGLLYAIPAGLALLWSWRARFFPDPEKKQDKPLPFLTEVLLYSTMPLFHLHTFIFLSFLLGCWIAAAIMRQSKGDSAATLVPLIQLVVCSVIPASLLIWYLTGGFKNGSVIHWVWGTHANPKSWDWFYDDQPQFATWAGSLHTTPMIASALGHGANWIVNYGALPFFVITLIYAIWVMGNEPANGRARAFVLPASLMFLISCFVMFAPWDWDNTKIMIWCYLAVLPFLWDRLLARENVWLRAVCCFMLFFSGFISLLGGIDATHTGYELADRAEVDGVASAVRPIPATAIFAGYPTYNHPLLLNGRKMVEGYNGHLESHGIDYKPNLAMLESLLNGEPGWRETARKLHARYLFWGKLEDENYPDSTRPWEITCPKIADGEFGKIYDLEATTAITDKP